MMEDASVAVEFLSVECDMIFEPECDLETDSFVESQHGGREREWNGATSTPHCPPSNSNPINQTLPSLDELFKGRNVGVYSRSDPEDHFVLIYEPKPQLLEEEEGINKGRDEWSNLEENEESEGDNEDRVSHRAIRCSVCRKQFRTRGCLVTHGLTHIQPSPGPPPPCPVCSALLPSRAALKIHVRRHFSMQTYQCPDCHEQLLSRTQLIMHQQIHANQRHHSFLTQKLTQTSTRYQPQEEIVRSPQVSRSPPVVKSPHVSKSPQQETKLLTPKEKQVSHTPEPEIRCERCNITFPTRAELVTHRKSHRERRNRRRRRHECPECGSQFWKSSGLKKHRKAEHDV